MVRFLIIILFCVFLAFFFFAYFWLKNLIRFIFSPVSDAIYKIENYYCKFIYLNFVAFIIIFGKEFFLKMCEAESVDGGNEYGK